MGIPISFKYSTASGRVRFFFFFIGSFSDNTEIIASLIAASKSDRFNTINVSIFLIFWCRNIPTPNRIKKTPFHTEKQNNKEHNLIIPHPKYYKSMKSN